VARADAQRAGGTQVEADPTGNAGARTGYRPRRRGAGWRGFNERAQPAQKRWGEWWQLLTGWLEWPYTGVHAAQPMPANQGVVSGDRVADRWVPLISEFSILRNR
jgi:hypothetical protein